jgi:hypothetical protein
MYKRPAYDIKTSGIYLFKTKDKEYIIKSYLFERDNDTEDGLEIQDELRDELGSIVFRNSAWNRLSKGNTIIAKSNKGKISGTLKRIDDINNSEKYEGGGMIDLFEDYDNIPDKVNNILEKYDMEDQDYESLEAIKKRVEKVGYTFDFGLDAVPYGLRPINVKINEVEGYEDEYAKGGALLKGKGSRAKNAYNKEVDAYKWFVVDLEKKIALAGNEYKEDAIDALEDYEGDKNFKVVSKSSLKKLGIEDPTSEWKYAEGGWLKDHKYVNKSEGYEMRYSKDKNHRKGYRNKKYAGGGEIESKIEDLQSVIDGDFPQFAKDKAKEEIEKLKKELHESKESKSEEKSEEKVSGTESKSKPKSDLEKELHRLQRDLNSNRLQTYIQGDNSEEAKAIQRERASKLTRFNEVLSLLNKKEEKHEESNELKKHIDSLSLSKFVDDASYILSADYDRLEGRSESKEGRDKITKELIDKINSSDEKTRIIYFKELGYKAEKIEEPIIKKGRKPRAEKPTERILGVEYTVGTKAHAKAVADKKHLDDLNKSESSKEPAKKVSHKEVLAKVKAKKSKPTPSNAPSKGHKRNEASDRKRTALPLGKRISESGNVYYENRLNRADKSKRTKFEEGGEVESNPFKTKRGCW